MPITQLYDREIEAISVPAEPVQASKGASYMPNIPNRPPDEAGDAAKARPPLTTFTPGPWFVSQNRHFVREKSSKGANIGELNTFFPDDERVANAHLIAAAPELYEALDLASEALAWAATTIGPDAKGGEELAAAWKKVEAALKKARGES